MARSRQARKSTAPVKAAPATEAPAICRAGFFQFAAHLRFTNTCVQSRALFWCKSGRGQFVANGVTYPLEPHDLYVLPWGRSITYLPSKKEPMYTAHVHLVPWYRPGSPWVPNVPHEPSEPEFNSPDRRDLSWPGLAGVIHLRLRADEPLGRLMDYAVHWFLQTKRAEAEARSLGMLLVRELLRAADNMVTPSVARSEELDRLIVHIDRCYYLAPRIEELATLVGRSRSHVLKLFRRHMGVSAKGYVIDRQLREARELLLSTTLPISEVGRVVGLPDPYHFSKLFRRHVGLAPREFRQEHGPFSTPPKPSEHRPSPPKSA